MLPTDEGFDGHVLLMRIQGQEILREDSSKVSIRVGAGESWDGFVEAVVSRGLWGVEKSLLSQARSAGHRYKMSQHMEPKSGMSSNPR